MANFLGFWEAAFVELLMVGEVLLRVGLRLAIVVVPAALLIWCALSIFGGRKAEVAPAQIDTGEAVPLEQDLACLRASPHAAHPAVAGLSTAVDSALKAGTRDDLTKLHAVILDPCVRMLEKVRVGRSLPAVLVENLTLARQAAEATAARGDSAKDETIDLIGSVMRQRPEFADLSKPARD